MGCCIGTVTGWRMAIYIRNVYSGVVVLLEKDLENSWVTRDGMIYR